MRDSSRRGVTTTIVAIVVHLAVFLAVRGTPLRSAAPPPADTAPAAELEVALDDVPPPANEAPRPAEGAKTEEPAAYAGAAPLGGSGPPVTALEPGPGGEPPKPVEAAPPASAGTAPVMLVMPSLDALGVATGNGNNPFLARGALPDMPGPSGRPASTEFHSAAPVPPSPAEANRRLAQGLKEGLQRKSDLGIGPEGPVVAALKDATYSGFTPVVGGATFVAIVDDKGLVTDLRLASSWPGGKEAHAGWEDARARAASALAGKKLPGNWMGADGHGARGAELKIIVESDLRLPSGTRPGGAVKPTASSSVVAVSPNLPGPGLPSDVSQTWTVGAGDLSDIGAKPRRIVSTRLVSAVEL